MGIDLQLDSIETTLHHRELIRRKTFLRRIYDEHYRFFTSELQSAPAGVTIELGSGGGFIKEVIPEAVTSDVVAVPEVDLVGSALELPFRDNVLRAILMINVFHHLADVQMLLNEATRCLKPGGLLLMVEPANTPFARFIYRHFHHEPFLPEQSSWVLGAGGRLSHANGALPWIVFSRDRPLFETRYPKLAIEKLSSFLPFRYLMSGGVSKPQLAPSFAYPVIHRLEKILTPWFDYLGMFMQVVVRKR